MDTSSNRRHSRRHCGNPGQSGRLCRPSHPRQPIAGCAPTIRSALPAPERLRSVLGRDQARAYPGRQPPERAVPQCRPPDHADEPGGRRTRPQDHRRTQSGALAGADGCARSSEIPRADAGLVHAGQSRQVRGPRAARSRAPPCSACSTRGGACDFVEDVALGYPLHVIMEILGVPEADEPRMLKLTQELFGPQDPDTARIREQLTRGAVLGDDAVGGGRLSAPISASITEDRRAQPARGSRHRHRQREDRRRLHAGSRRDQLLHDRRHRRPRHHLILDRRRDLGAGGGPRGVREGEGQPGTDPGPGRRGDPLDDAREALHALGDRRTPSSAAARSPKATG